MSPLNDFFSRLHPWTWIDDPLATSAQQGLDRDHTLTQEVSQGLRGATARLWENPESLIVTRQEARLPDFARACQAFNDQHCPVLIRQSGGTAVPHQPGIIHFSLIYPLEHHQRYDLDQAYQALCEPLRQALERLGLKADYGSVEGSYCDGRYNLAVAGRKVTGTAQRLITGPRTAGGQRRAVLAQAMLMVECDAQAGTERVNRFYQLAGDSRRYNPAASASIAQLLEAQGLPVPPGLTRHLRRLVAAVFAELTAPH